MAVMMLALYAVVSLASDVVSLTCDCHHSLCAHSLEHTPSHNHCDCGGGCEHESVAMSCQGCAPQFNSIGGGGDRDGCLLPLFLRNGD